MGAKDNQEFKNAIRDISLNVWKLDSAYDRVRCVEWVRKLLAQRDDSLESCKVRNEYAQLLRIQVKNNIMHGPFLNNPPDRECLCPLAEILGQFMAKKIPNLPKSGPIAPVLHHKSPDGRAYISAKQIPGGGVFVYMAVSPEGLRINF